MNFPRLKSGLAKLFSFSQENGTWERMGLPVSGQVFLSILFLILFNNCSQPVTLNSLLEEMTDREHLSYYPSHQPFVLKQVSSYNRASVSKDSAGWYANYDMSHFVGVEEKAGRREFILFDEKGPGAIVRWWMTFYKAQNGTLRVYLDNDSIAVIQGAPREVLSGDRLAGYPFTASVQEGAPLGGEGRDYDHNLYLPIPFAEHARITYECDALEKKFEYEGVPVPGGYYWPDVFYNICYRQYPVETKVESFSMEALHEAKSLLDQTGKLLMNNRPDISIIKEFGQKINPGDSLVIEFSGKDQAIKSLSLALQAVNPEQALRSVVLSAFFDGIRTIWVPAGEFFGTGYIPVSHKSFMNQRLEDGTMESFWVMPFRDHGQLIFFNYGPDEIFIKGSAGIGPYKWKSNSLYFGAAWHEYRHINSRNEIGSPFDINFINIRGKGLYVGDQITLFNNTYHWWGEGDEKIYVDGETFPSSFGTGSEDYYGYSFGRPDPFSHPFISQPVGKGNTSWGVTVNLRHRSLDAIPFSSSIRADIELWHWASIKMNYALTSYWYVAEPHEIDIQPNIQSVKFPVVMTREDFNISGDQ